MRHVPELKQLCMSNPVDMRLDFSSLGWNQRSCEYFNPGPQVASLARCRRREHGSGTSSVLMNCKNRKRVTYAWPILKPVVTKLASAA